MIFAKGTKRNTTNDAFVRLREQADLRASFVLIWVYLNPSSFAAELTYVQVCLGASGPARRVKKEV